MPEQKKNNLHDQDALVAYYASSEIAPAANPYWAARRALAKKLEQLQLQIQTSETTIEELNRIGDAVEAQTQTLIDNPKRYGRTEWTADDKFGSWGMLQCEATPIIGPSNPISPELSIWFEADGDAMKAFAHVTFNWCYEGSDNICHGGWVAAVFDEFLGTSQILSGKTGMTGYLTTRYHSPTPLNQQLLMTARVDKVEDKKVTMVGELHAGERLCASCEGLFIIPNKKRGVSAAFGETDAVVSHAGSSGNTSGNNSNSN